MNPITERIDNLRMEISVIDDEQGCEWDDNLACQRSDLDCELRDLTGEEYKFKSPTLAECEAAVGEPAEKWVSRCHEIAVKILDGLKLPGKDQYGFYYGPIQEDSSFHPRLFARHGWVLLEDGRIFDPTRWTFDSPGEPYIFCLHPDWFDGDEYDFGMNRYREANLRPPPKFGEYDEDGEKQVGLKLSGQDRDFVQDLFDELPPSNGWIVLTKAQVFWLANYPHHLFGTFAKSVYEAIIEAGFSIFIPVDNAYAEGL